MTVLVCGGRGFYNRALVYRVLDEIKPSLVVNGAASGADDLSTQWAQERGVTVREFPADWKTGRSAGPIRNAVMLRDGKPDLVVAFPGGDGTHDMKTRARKAGVEVREIESGNP